MLTAQSGTLATLTPEAVIASVGIAGVDCACTAATRKLAARKAQDTVCIVWSCHFTMCFTCKPQCRRSIHIAAMIGAETTQIAAGNKAGVRKVRFW